MRTRPAVLPGPVSDPAVPYAASASGPRTAILDEGEGRFRALFYPIERPTTNLTPKVYPHRQVLAEWRSAERRLVELDPESEEARDVVADIELLREQHHVLFERRRGA